MVQKKRILYISGEMKPFLELTEFADLLNKLAVFSNQKGYEVRCIMPRFGTINERRHRLHEVVRLSGLTINLNGKDYVLQIKVASLPNARLQVYFLDNEEMFKRKALLHNEEGKWFDDNELRHIFFSKSALEIMKKFGWPPNIIHCGGFMASLIPLYIKTIYKREAVFSKSKIIYTLNDNTFKDSLNKSFLKLASIHDSIKPEHMEPFKGLNNSACMKGGAAYADIVSFCNPKIEKKFAKDFEQLKGKTILSYDVTNSLDDYFELYERLTDK